MMSVAATRLGKARKARIDNKAAIGLESEGKIGKERGGGNELVTLRWQEGHLVGSRRQMLAPSGSTKRVAAAVGKGGIGVSHIHDIFGAYA